MEKPKQRMAGVMLTLAALLAAPVHAASFDEKLPTPRVTTSQALRAKVKAHFATFASKQQDEDPAAFIRDRAAHQQWSDVWFSVKTAADEGISLKDLGAFGISAEPGGGYAIDLREFPQWEPLDSRLRILNNSEVAESFMPALQARGFRDEDVNALRTYLATHDPQFAVHAEGRQLVDTFAARLRLQRQAGRSPSLQEILAYRYQKVRIKDEAERQWAVGLLESLDTQRQRILLSYLEEFGSTLKFGGSAASFATDLQGEAQPILSGEYVRMIADDEVRLRQDMQRRAQKLREGDRR